MTSLPKPDVIITHESDLDGLVSGVLLQLLAKKLHGANVPLQAFHYNTWKQYDVRERAAWITDLSFEPRLDKPEFVIVDHHTTEAQPKYALLIHDTTKSAGSLCYELCKEHGLGTPALDRLVHLNNVADLFLEDDPDFEAANDYANLVKHYQFWNLHQVIGGDITKLLDHPLLEVMAVKRRVEDPLGLAWSKGNVTEISPTIGCVETVIGNTNIIIHKMLEQNATPYQVLLTLARRGNYQVFVSLRSRNGEALKVAEKLQGGGHPNACGAVLPKSVRNIPDAVEYLRQLLGPKPGAPLNSMEALFTGFATKQQ